jgi:hypothetical protein
MPSQILRPTGPGSHKRDRPWRIEGPWGRRDYPPGTSTELYNRLYDELVQAGQLDKTVPRPSRRYHTHVVLLVMKSSWVNGKWVTDEPVVPAECPPCGLPSGSLEFRKELCRQKRGQQTNL